MRSFLPLLLLGLLRPCTTELPSEQQCDSSIDGDIYKYQAKTLTEGQTVNFSNYADKAILFVNVATYWGYTYQYNELNALQKEMGDKFVILGFPSNQFGKQEPGQGHEILPGLKFVRPGDGFVPNFQLFEKGDVNGKDEQEVYTFLKSACPAVGSTFRSKDLLFWEPLQTNDIKWNFEKILVGRNGKPLMRWSPDFPITDIRNKIRLLFSQQAQDFK